MQNCGYMHTECSICVSNDRLYLWSNNFHSFCVWPSRHEFFHPEKQMHSSWSCMNTKWVTTADTNLQPQNYFWRPVVLTFMEISTHKYNPLYSGSSPLLASMWSISWPSLLPFLHLVCQLLREKRLHSFSFFPSLSRHSPCMKKTYLTHGNK